MKTIKQIREEIATLDAEAQAIVDVATEEKRELADDEQNRIDAILGKGDAQGLVAELHRDLDRLQKLEARKKELAAERLGTQLATADEGGSSGSTASEFNISVGGTTPVKLKDPIESLVIPAKAKTYTENNLKAFAGDAKAAYAMGQWFMAAVLGSKSAKAWIKDNGLQASLATTDNAKGGLFVPTEMSTAIIRLVEEFGVIRRNSRIEPMGSDRKVVPIRTGGMTAYPTEETTSVNQGSNTTTESTPTYTPMELVARKWKAVTRMSDEISEDTVVQLAAEVVREIALAFAYAEDNAGFNGDGSSAFHGIVGILNAVLAGSVYTAATGNTSFATLDLADFEAMAGKVPDYAGINPAWYISKPGYFASMHRLQMAAGGNTTDNLAAGGEMMFLGYPVRFTNVLNKALTAQTSTKLCVLGDLDMGVRFGDRRQITISLTDQRYWDEDQIGLKGTERFDIGVHSKGTATEAGALVVLETPAS